MTRSFDAVCRLLVEDGEPKSPPMMRPAPFDPDEKTFVRGVGAPES